MDFVERYHSDEHTVGLQVSMYSTNPEIRAGSSKVPLFSHEDIRELAVEWRERHPADRLVTLSFTLTDTSHCLPSEIVSDLPPELFWVKLHPYKANGLGLRRMSAENCRRLAVEFEALGYTVIHEVYDELEENSLVVGGTLAMHED